jgi:hypothetical protein
VFEEAVRVENRGKDFLSSGKYSEALQCLLQSTSSIRYVAVISSVSLCIEKVQVLFWSEFLTVMYEKGKTVLKIVRRKIELRPFSGIRHSHSTELLVWE